MVSCPVPLTAPLYTLRQHSAAVRVPLEEYEMGRCALQDAVRAAYDALCEEREALGAQLAGRGEGASPAPPAWPSAALVTSLQVSVLADLVLENGCLGRRLAGVLGVQAAGTLQ